MDRENAKARNSKEQLKRAMEVKFKTTMIGALSRFEQTFGDLWGDKAPFNTLTPEQKEFREDWELVRSQILDNGNDQLRAAFQELDNYTVQWNKYQMDFIVKKPRN